MLQIRNDGIDVMAVVSGTVAEGTTAADVADFDTSGSTGVPLWWRAGATILVPVGARDVWPVAGRPDLTILCQTADGEVTRPGRALPGLTRPGQPPMTYRPDTAGPPELPALRILNPK